MPIVALTGAYVARNAGAGRVEPWRAFVIGAGDRKRERTQGEKSEKSQGGSGLGGHGASGVSADFAGDKCGYSVRFPRSPCQRELLSRRRFPRRLGDRGGPCIPAVRVFRITQNFPGTAAFAASGGPEMGLCPRPMTASKIRPSDGDESALVRLTIWSLSAFVLVAVTVVMTTVRPTEHGGSLLLPTVNAVLNGGAACFLVTGYVLIRNRRIRAHKVCMLSAVVLSSLFLISYLAHHIQAGSVRYQGEGVWRTVYLALLIPHVLLAAPIVPMALFTVYRGLSGKLDQHRRIARFTLPLWLYVSVSGVLIYLMLYHGG